jgi:hypothetical protein
VNTLFYARWSVQVWINLAKVAIGTVRAAETGKMDSTGFCRVAKNGHIFVMTDPQARCCPSKTA